MKGRFLTQETILSFKERLVLEERSAATVEKYVRDVKALAVHLNDDAFTKETVIAYKKHLQKKVKHLQVQQKQFGNLTKESLMRLTT